LKHIITHFYYFFNAYFHIWQFLFFSGIYGTGRSYIVLFEKEKCEMKFLRPPFSFREIFKHLIGGCDREPPSPPPVPPERVTKMQTHSPTESVSEHECHCHVTKDNLQ